jgi:hypothetical protein
LNFEETWKEYFNFWTYERKKMKLDASEIEVNGVAYVPKGSENRIEYDGDIKIVILQRGWVMVGRFERDDNDCKLHDASVIRIWGTSKGLGEIASNGPIKDKTVLDKCGGVVEFDWLTVVASISVDEKKWKNAL